METDCTTAQIHQNNLQWCYVILIHTLISLICSKLPSLLLSISQRDLESASVWALLKVTLKPQSVCEHPTTWQCLLDPAHRQYLSPCSLIQHCYSSSSMLLQVSSDITTTALACSIGLFQHGYCSASMLAIGVIQHRYHIRLPCWLLTSSHITIGLVQHHYCSASMLAIGAIQHRYHSVSMLATGAIQHRYYAASSHDYQSVSMLATCLISRCYGSINILATSIIPNC